MRKPSQTDVTANHLFQLNTTARSAKTYESKDWGSQILSLALLEM